MKAFIYQMMRGWGSVCILLMQGPQIFWQNQMQGCSRPIYLGNKKYMTNAERSRNKGSKLFWLNKRHVIPSNVMLIVRDVPTDHAVSLTLFKTPLTPPPFLWTFGRFFWRTAQTLHCSIWLDNIIYLRKLSQIYPKIQTILPLMSLFLSILFI